MNSKNNYKILGYACATKETGPDYPQVQKMKPGYDLSAPDSVNKMARYFTSLPDFKPNLDYFVLRNKAKPSDLISCSLGGPGLLLSSRFKDILTACNLPLHAYYPAKVFHKGNIIEGYFWLHLVCDLTDYVDYKASTFFINKNFLKDIGDIELDSKEDYEVKQKELEEKDFTLFISAKKLQFINTFNNALDLFKIGRFNGDRFISKKLSQLLMDHQITGLEIKENNIIV